MIIRTYVSGYDEELSMLLLKHPFFLSIGIKKMNGGWHAKKHLSKNVLQFLDFGMPAGIHSF